MLSSSAGWWSMSGKTFNIWTAFPLNMSYRTEESHGFLWMSSLKKETRRIMIDLDWLFEVQTCRQWTEFQPTRLSIYYFSVKLILFDLSLRSNLKSLVYSSEFCLRIVAVVFSFTLTLKKLSRPRHSDAILLGSKLCFRRVKFVTRYLNTVGYPRKPNELLKRITKLGYYINIILILILTFNYFDFCCLRWRAKSF